MGMITGRKKESVKEREREEGKHEREREKGRHEWERGRKARRGE